MSKYIAVLLEENNYEAFMYGFPQIEKGWSIICGSFIGVNYVPGYDILDT